MSTVFHRFVNKIVQQTGGSQVEKEDLYEELMIHLEISKEQFMKEGFHEKESVQKAIESFGDAEEIGSQIQHAMFPFRKEMMLILSFLSILFSFGTYLGQLFLEGNAEIVWLIMSIIISSLILVSAVYPNRYFNYRFWLNTLFIIHVCIYAYGGIVASDIDNFIYVILFFLIWLIILLDIALLYMTTINEYQSGDQSLTQPFIRLHILNITTGIILVVATLFFLWGLLFASEWSPAMLKIFIPLLIWLIAYILQISLLAKHKKIAYTIAIIPILMLVGTIGLQVILWRP